MGNGETGMVKAFRISVELRRCLFFSQTPLDIAAGSTRIRNALPFPIPDPPLPINQKSVYL